MILVTGATGNAGGAMALALIVALVAALGLRDSLEANKQSTRFGAEKAQ